MPKETYKQFTKREKLPESRTTRLGKLALEATAGATIAANYGIRRAGHASAIVGRSALRTTELASKRANQRLTKAKENVPEFEPTKPLAFVRRVGSLALRASTRVETKSINLQTQINARIENSHKKHRGDFWERSRVTKRSKAYLENRKQEKREKLADADRKYAKYIKGLTPDDLMTDGEKAARTQKRLARHETRAQTRKIKFERDQKLQGTPIKEVVGIDQEKYFAMLEDKDLFKNKPAREIMVNQKTIPGKTSGKLHRKMYKAERHAVEKDVPTGIFATPIGYSTEHQPAYYADPVENKKRRDTRTAEGKIPEQDIFLCSDKTFRMYDPVSDRWTSLPLGGQEKRSYVPPSDPKEYYKGGWTGIPEYVKTGNEPTFYEGNYEQDKDNTNVWILEQALRPMGLDPNEASNKPGLYLVKYEGKE